MSTNSVLRAAGLTAAILILAACTGQPAKPTVTFAGNECSYAGPDQVPMRFTIRWSVEDPVPSGAILRVVSLDPGRTREELAVLPNQVLVPDWVHLLSWDQTFSLGSRSHTVDLGPNAAYGGEPIYIVCFYNDKDTAIGAVGPLKVVR
jgi:hypothetical protein